MGPSLVVILAEFGSEVKPNVTVFESELAQQRYLVGHVQLDLIRQWGGFGKVGQILEGESQVDRLLHFNLYWYLTPTASTAACSISLALLLGRLDIVIIIVIVISQYRCTATLLQSHSGGTDFTLGRETDAFFGDFDLDTFANVGEIATDASKFRGGHFDDGVVLGIGNAEMLGIYVHELQFEFADSVGFGRLKGHLESVAIVGFFERENIVVVGSLEDLSERGEGYADGHGSITSKFLETVGTELYRGEGDVGVVHSLKTLLSSKRGQSAEGEEEKEEISMRIKAVQWRDKRGGGMTYNTVLGTLKVGIGDELTHGVENLLELLCGKKSQR